MRSDGLVSALTLTNFSKKSSMYLLVSSACLTIVLEWKKSYRTRISLFLSVHLAQPELCRFHL